MRLLVRRQITMVGYYQRSLDRRLSPSTTHGRDVLFSFGFDDPTDELSGLLKFRTGPCGLGSISGLLWLTSFRVLSSGWLI